MRGVAAAVAASLLGDAIGALSARLLREGDVAVWSQGLPEPARRWLEATGFKPKAGAVSLMPAADGALAGAGLVVGAKANLWDAALLQATLPAGIWRLEDPDGLLDAGEAALGWALGAYRFDRYRSGEQPPAGPRLAVGAAALARATAIAEAIYLARDLVSTPASDLGPVELEEAIRDVGDAFGGTVRTVSGSALAAGYPMVHAVGKGSPRAPRLVELTWGRAEAPKLTLIGKGVCFDTGGLDIKPSSGMLLMRKDMGGAALMLGLASCVMALGLDVRLRLLVPAVENSVSGEAFRPGDILKSRKGLTVEIGNTDAEGRLILADALADADAEAPALLIDAATLTGAARVAVGPDLPALFTPDETLAADLLAAGRDVADPLWRLPLHEGYAGWLKGGPADLSNTGTKPQAGAITAALFLQRFVEKTTAWAHLDIYAWNDEQRPGRPKGGEATALRALLALIERRFGGAA